jgi:hypothetical protein
MELKNIIPILPPLLAKEGPGEVIARDRLLYSGEK